MFQRGRLCYHCRTGLLGSHRKHIDSDGANISVSGTPTVYLEDKSADVKLDRNLRRPVYRVLDHFLVVMGNVHKIYACRDCFKIICPPCYESLRNGTGTHINCHETHTHLHVPPVDAQKFIDRPRDIVWVAGEDVQLQQWLDSIKSDWGLEQRSVKARERLINAVRRVMQLRAIGAKTDKYDAVPSEFKYYNDTSAGR